MPQQQPVPTTKQNLSLSKVFAINESAEINRKIVRNRYFVLKTTLLCIIIHLFVLSC